MEPIRGVWVTLHRVGPDLAGPLDSVKSDARGRYSFHYVRTGSQDAVYFVSASFDGIAYFTSPLAEGKVAGNGGEVLVFDTTSRPIPMSVRGHHVVVSAVDANGQRSVVEVYDLSNDTSITRIAPSDQPKDATWAAHLIPGATNFRVSQGDFPAAAVSFAEDKVNVFAPFAPGLKQLSFAYSLPAKSFPLSLPVEKENQIYEILIEEKAGHVTGPHLREVDPVTVDERDFRRFLASDVPANSVAVIDLPAPPPNRAIDPRYLVAITLVIGGSMVFALARALGRR
ncbi:MAG: hypothetical protein ABI408_02905 [Gemmatimonadaceae bacterium]